MDKEKKISVKSRNGGKVFYHIPEDRIIRTFKNNETKMIPAEELMKLYFTDGGEYLIRNSLIIEDKEMLKELNIEVEPEYYYTDKDVSRILMEGSLEEFEDMLNFGCDGIIELAQQLSVRLELPDTRKRKMILEKTGFNIDTAIEIKNLSNEDGEQRTEPEKPVRKAASPSEPKRKYTPPKYITNEVN